MEVLDRLRQVIYGIDTSSIDSIFNNNVETIEAYKVVRQLADSERDIIQNDFSESDLAKLAKHVQETVDYDKGVLKRSKEINKQDLALLINLVEDHYITTVSGFILTGPRTNNQLLHSMTRATMMLRAAGSDIMAMTDKAIAEGRDIVKSAIDDDRPESVIHVMNDLIDAFEKGKGLFVEGIIRINNEHNKEDKHETDK